MKSKEPQRLTVRVIRAAAALHPYLLIRFADGKWMPINSKIVFLGKKNMSQSDTDLTDIIAWAPCSMHVYISHKNPFVT